MFKRLAVISASAIILSICSYASAQQMSATVTYTDNEAKVSYGLAGLPYETDCDAILKDENSVEIETISSTEGPYKRNALFTGLTAATTYRLYITCGLPYDIVNDDAFTTMPAQADTSYTMSSVGGVHPILDTGARAQVLWGPNSSLANTPVQNTSCAGSCTINVTPTTPGLWFREWQWQTAGDVVIGRSGTNIIVIGDARQKTLTSSPNGEEPNIPNLAKWELHMQFGTGDRHADEACNAYATQGVLFGTYYDGAWVMENIAAYLNGKYGTDATAWYDCAQTAHDTYLRNYVLPNFGSVPGYNEFTTGMRLTYERLGSVDVEYKNGIQYQAGYRLDGGLGNGAAYCSLDWDNQDEAWIREASYCLRSMIDSELVGVTPQVSKREAMVAKVLEFSRNSWGSPSGEQPSTRYTDWTLYPPGNACEHKYFSDSLYAALANSILITYVDDFGDPGNHHAEIFSQVKWVADFLWNYQKIPGYPIIEFEQCWNSPAPADMANPILTPRDTPSRLSAADLNLLMVDTFGWLYKETCDTSYRQKADDLFSWGVDHAVMDIDGKHFNQQYQYSFKYVERRQQPCTGIQQPPIPNLAFFKSQAVSHATLACQNYVTGDVTAGTYYDAMWAMEKLIEQVNADGGDSTPWVNCLNNVAIPIWRDNYVLRADVHGTVPGYNEFTTGCRLHYQRTGDIASYKCVSYQAGYHLTDSIGTAAAYCGGGGGTDYMTTSPALLREMGYCMRSMLDANKIGIAITDHTPSKREAVFNNMLVQIDEALISKTARMPAGGDVPQCVGKWYHQPFMYAIQARALIDYYETTGLEYQTVYDNVKVIADWMWDNARVPGYNVFWYDNCKDDPSDPTWNLSIASPPVQDLVLEFPDIYQWLYMHNCDTSYRDKADGFFTYATGQGSMDFLDYDGKHYNQSMTFVREYIRLRQLPSPICQ